MNIHCAGGAQSGVRRDGRVPPRRKESDFVRYVRLISIAMTLLGIAMVIASEALGAGGMWTLTGLLLTVAGVVKVIMVGLWNGVAGFGAAQPTRDER